MSFLQSVKKAVEQVTGVARPGRQEVIDLVRLQKPDEFHFGGQGRQDHRQRGEPRGIRKGLRQLCPQPELPSLLDVSEKPAVKEYENANLCRKFRTSSRHPCHRAL